MRNLCAFALFLAAAIAAQAAGPTTQLNIVVKTQGGHPVDRASVVVKCLGRSVAKLGKLECPAYELRTNEEGVVKLPPIPQGKIRVQVIAKGYQTFGQDYTINDEQKSLEIKLNPPQQQYSAHQ
jgi:hypothetical protein